MAAKGKLAGTAAWEFLMNLENGMAVRVERNTSVDLRTTPGSRIDRKAALHEL